MYTPDASTLNRTVNLVRQTGFDIHVYLGPGHLEKVYGKAMVNRLTKAGAKVEEQVPLRVFDEDGSLLGEFYADLLVDGWLIVELKAAKEIADVHIAQILGYLRAGRLEHGMILNFGAAKYQPRKFIAS